MIVYKYKDKQKILIVDDEKLIRWSLVRTLSCPEQEVDAAESGEDALEKLGKTFFDLIITDLKMSGIDGLTLLKEVKKRNPHCQVIIITAYGTPQLAEEARKWGAVDFISKPLAMDEMREVVRKNLR